MCILIKMKLFVFIGVLISVMMGYPFIVRADSFPWPVDTSINTNSGYPYSSSHTGEDFPCSTGTPVYAVTSGTVSYYYCTKNGSTLSSYGNLAILSSGSYQFYYAHLSGFEFGVDTPLGNAKTYPSSGGSKHLIDGGFSVQEGQIIGYVGQAGNATGPHLHCEVRINGTPYPPLNYLERRDPTPGCSCSASYAGTYICTSKTTLNIRDSHSTSGKYLGSIPSGAEVYVSKADGSWAHVSYGGIDGYAYMEYLKRKTNYYTLDLNGLLDDRISGSLENYGTADVYINGALVADDVSDYCESLAEGTTFKFTDFKAHDGYFYSGFDGYLSGIISDGGAELKVIFYTAGKAMSSGYNRTIPDGDYLICAAGTTNKSTFYFLDIEGTAQPAANETNVSLCGPLGYDPPSYEAWNLTYQDGFYTIRQAGTNMCLDVYGGSAIQAKNVQVYTSNDSTSQKWAICENGRDGYRIQAKCSGLSLDIDGCLIENGRNVHQWKNNDTASQSWIFIPYRPSQPIENGRYILMSAISDHLELDVDGDTGDVPENANIQIWEDSAPSKYNSFDIQKLSNGYYKFTHIASGKCLEVSNGTSGYSDNIAIHTDNGSLAQQWAIISDADRYCVVAKCSGYALDVANSSTKNGANVLTFPIHGASNQTWRFVPAEYTVKYDSNGGTGVPKNQTKYYKENLILSVSEPSRNGYEFMGWAKTKTAVTAQFTPGDIYSNDADVTFYAVWKMLKPDFVLPSALQIIGEETFEGGSFTYVKLSENTTTIKSRAFADCRHLAHIYIPEVTTTIATDAFSGVDKSLCIHGTDGSYAEFYACNYGFQFVAE